MTTVLDTVKGPLDRAAQRLLVEQVRKVLLVVPLRDLLTPGGKPMSVRVSAAGALGWTSDAHGYRYIDRAPSGKAWPAIPDEWKLLADSFVLEPQPWDSALIIWYGPDAKLGEHVDDTEVDRKRPIVVFGVGDSAVWSARPDAHSDVERCIVNSGGVTVLEGVTRGWLHSIERIIPEPIFSPLGTKRGRLAIRMAVAG